LKTASAHCILGRSWSWNFQADISCGRPKQQLARVGPRERCTCTFFFGTSIVSMPARAGDNSSFVAEVASASATSFFGRCRRTRSIQSWVVSLLRASGRVAGIAMNRAQLTSRQQCFSDQLPHRSQPTQGTQASKQPPLTRTHHHQPTALSASLHFIPYTGYAAMSRGSTSMLVMRPVSDRVCITIPLVLL
jgi:hypothetical protein